MPGTAHVSLAEALAKGPPPPGNLAVPIFSRGSLAVEMYTPKDADPQEPHDRDEIYLIARGTGMFFDGVARRPVEAGTFLFVGAGQPHRFEQFSPDFASWVFFYGPSGGEGVDRVSQGDPPDVRESDVEDVIHKATTVFALDLQGAEVVRRGRATVVRASSLTGVTKGPVIIKQFDESHREHFVRERGGLRVLSAVRAIDRLVPRLLGEDEADRLLLVEGIVEQTSYPEVIFSGGDDATRTLVETARRLGLLHGHARSRVDDLRAQIPRQPDPGRLLRKGLEATLTFIRRALWEDAGVAPDVAVCEEVRSQLLDVADGVNARDDLCTVTVGDMAPSNVLLGPAGPVFIDLEYCGVRNAFYDAMFWHCICPFPADVTDRMDVAYRDALATTGVDLGADRFSLTMLLFMSHRLFWMMSWKMDALLQRDRDVVPGVSLRRTFCEYLREYIRFSAAAPRLEHPALVSVATSLEARLSRTWPEVAAGG